MWAQGRQEGRKGSSGVKQGLALPTLTFPLLSSGTTDSVSPPPPGMMFCESRQVGKGSSFLPGRQEVPEDTVPLSHCPYVPLSLLSHCPSCPSCPSVSGCHHSPKRCCPSVTQAHSDGQDLPVQREKLASHGQFPWKVRIRLILCVFQGCPCSQGAFISVCVLIPPDCPQSSAEQRRQCSPHPSNRTCRGAPRPQTGPV